MTELEKLIEKEVPHVEDVPLQEAGIGLVLTCKHCKILKDLLAFMKENAVWVVDDTDTVPFEAVRMSVLEGVKK